VGGQISSANAIQGNSLLLGGSGRYTDRPTITYAPLTGDKFVRGMMEPIPPQSIFSLIQSGYAADFVLGLGVDAMNGLRNQSFALGSQRTADPEFIRAVRLFRQIQISGAVGMRIEKSTDSAPATVLFFRKENMPSELENQILELKQLMGIGPGEQRA